MEPFPTSPCMRAGPVRSCRVDWAGAFHAHPDARRPASGQGPGSGASVIGRTQASVKLSRMAVRGSSEPRTDSGVCRAESAASSSLVPYTIGRDRNAKIQFKVSRVLAHILESGHGTSSWCPFVKQRPAST